MTREENLHWIDEEIRTWENECQSKHPIKEALYAARRALEQEPFMNKACVSEKVCEHDKECFGEPTMYGFRVDRVVAAWMPLPKPYKEDKE